METNLKLNEITTEYSKFNANQVLTEKQLNAFINYFDDQDRLSRIGLSGVGLACGFGITTLFNSDKTAAISITITQGTAVTTDGDYVQFLDLIKDNIASKKFSYFKKFDDDKATYDRFLNSQGDQLELWELHVNDDASYSDLVSFPNIQNMAVLLYLEQYAKEDELCNKLTCDNQGIEQINNLRVLLIDVDNLKSTVSKDTIYSNNNWHELYDSLNHIVVPRDIVRIKENSEETDFIQLKKIYQTVLEDGALKSTIKTDLNTVLKRAQKTVLGNNFDTLFETTKNNALQDFQYRYDALKDIVATYTEIQELLLHINFQCCPNIGAFPKHIMLGSLNVNTSAHELRHEFYESAIIGQSKENWQQLQLLLDRVLLLVNNYILLAPDNTIKITPSLSIATLGQKAIPAYYSVSNNLLTSWNFKKTLNAKQTTNLSYHTDNLLKHPAIKEPLKYTIDNFNFFRIEGVHGKNYRTAIEDVQKLRDDNGLNFDIITLKLSVNNDAINLNKYESMFRDLQLTLLLWQKDLNCTLALATTLLSSFSTEEVGGNTSVKTKTKAFATPDKTVADGSSYMLDMYSGSKYPKANMYLEEMYYYANTTLDVEDSISKEPKTIGAVFIEILKDTRGNISAEELKAALEKQILPLVDTDEWNAAPAIKDIAILRPIEILAYIYALSIKVPTTLVDLTDAKVNAFNEALVKICELNDTYKAKYDQTDISDELKKDIGILITHLSSICCSGEKLDIIVAELNSRKASILNQLQFKEYIKEHPGIRHLAGVQEGGTFIMVYLEESESGLSAYQTSQISFTFLKQPNIDDEGLDGDEGRIELWDKFLSTNFAFIPNYIPGVTQNPVDEIIIIEKALTKTVANFVNFLNKKWRLAGAEDLIKATIDPKDEVTVIIEINNQKVNKGENFIYFHNPAIIGLAGKTYFQENEEVDRQIVGGNTVVADFALPYRCCGNGTSVNFIIPKEPLFLSLPESSICLKEGILVAPLVFTSTPENVIVKAVVPEGIAVGIFIDEVTGETKIDVHQIDASLLGTTIQFTANDEPTNCQIIVYPAVVLSINTEAPLYNDDKSEANVRFTLIWGDTDFENSALANQIKYAWDYTDQGTFIEQAPNDNQFTNTYTLPINETNIITPRLQVSLGPCINFIPIEAIEFETLEPSELEITPTFCFNIKQEVAEINFTNINGAITIDGRAINGLLIKEGKIIITAPDFQSFGEEISFLENGQTTNAQITIYPIVNLTTTTKPIDYNDDKSLANVTFVINLDDLGFENPDLITNIKYEWDFLGDGNFTSLSPDDKLFSNTYELPVNETNTITPKLRVSLGTCSNDIPIDTIIFDVFTPSKLGIASSFCFDINNETEEINFTNAIGEITIDGGDIDGLDIQNGTLIITGGAFQSFEQNIRFLEDGQTTNAQITIHEVKQIAIEEGGNATYFWKEERLFYKADFQPKLPTGTASAGLIYKWASSDGQDVTAENFNPEFEVFNTTSNSFEITLQIRDENKCTSEAILIKEIPYPNFEISLRDTVFCLNDEKAYEVNINPNFEGTLLNGGEVTFNTGSGIWEFIPKNLGLANAGSITIELVGSSVSETINLITEAVADFSGTFNPATRILRISNDSGVGNSYIWIINGKEETRTDKTPVDIDVRRLTTNEVEVSLTVISDCGRDTKIETIPFDIPVETTCESETLGRINKDLTTFDLNDTDQSFIKNDVIAPTINLYDKIIADNANYLKGTRNDELTSLFRGLMTTTVDLLTELNEESLKKYYIGQIKLFINILHCQGENLLEENRAFLTDILGAIKNNLSSFKTFGIDLDTTGELKVFLTKCAEEIKAPFIVQEINGYINNI